MFAAKSFTPRVIALLVAGALCLSLQGRARAAAKLSTTDQEYLRQATQEVLGEKEMGQMARDKAKDTEVVHFAREQVTGAEKMETELHDFADKHSYALPGKDVQNDVGMARLEKVKKATDFDKEYVASEINDHNNMIDLFTKAADKVDNADFKTWLQDKTKSLKIQLDDLKKLSDKLNK